MRNSPTLEKFVRAVVNDAKRGMVAEARWQCVTNAAKQVVYELQTERVTAALQLLLVPYASSVLYLHYFVLRSHEQWK